MNRNDGKWEAITRRFEAIDFAALADDEKAALQNEITRTLGEMMHALTNGECSTKLGNRASRAIGRLNKQIEEWLGATRPRRVPSP
jgi:hypothetical protein